MDAISNLQKGGKQMVTFIILALTFLILGIIFLEGKGSNLIAGYNTMSKEQKNKYDEKKLNKVMAIFCFIITAIFSICFFIKDTNTMMYILFTSIIVTVILAIIILNTYCRKK